MANYPEIARMLQGRLQGLSGGEISDEWREFLESAGEELGMKKEDFVQSRKRSKTTLTEKQPCRHFCREHKELMDPSSLPYELLQLVFARLPLNKILELQCLSKHWGEALSARQDSVFLKACEAARPRMFALFSRIHQSTDHDNLFRVRMFDMRLNSWQVFQYLCEIPQISRAAFVKCEDGGLVVIDLSSHRGRYSPWLCLPMHLRVMNPLTRYACDLPAIGDVERALMYHITVDRERRCYKVLVVVRTLGKSTDDVRVYDSETREWSQPHEAADVMYGGQSAQDFARGRLVEDQSGAQRTGQYPFDSMQHVMSCTFLKSRFFMLVKDINGPAGGTAMTYCIKEYAVAYHPERPATWSEVDVHRCDPFERIPKSSFSFTLLSAGGFLMVFAGINEQGPWRNQKGWLYDLGTRTWRDLPKLPGKIDSDIPCEILWNAQP